MAAFSGEQLADQYMCTQPVSKVHLNRGNIHVLRLVVAHPIDALAHSVIRMRLGVYWRRDVERCWIISPPSRMQRKQIQSK